MKVLIKYGTVILLFLLLIHYTHTYYDFTASNSNIIILPLVTGLIFVNFILIYIYESKNKEKHKVTNLLLIFLVAFFGINLYLNSVQSEKEVKYSGYISPDPQLKSNGYEIKLYKDKTYRINEYWHSESRHYFGKYEFENNLLTLHDERISEKTEELLTSKYNYNSIKKYFEPIDKGFPKLKLKNKE